MLPHKNVYVHLYIQASRSFTLYKIWCTRIYVESVVLATLCAIRDCLKKRKKKDSKHLIIVIIIGMPYQTMPCHVLYTITFTEKHFVDHALFKSSHPYILLQSLVSWALMVNILIPISKRKTIIIPLSQWHYFIYLYTKRNHLFIFCSVLFVLLGCILWEEWSIKQI